MNRYLHRTVAASPGFAESIAARSGIACLLAMPATGSAAATRSAPGLSGAGDVLTTIGLVLLLAVIGTICVRRIVKTTKDAADRRRMERIVKEQSADHLDDFILPGAYGGLTRIDHSVLTESGIFCIQTKFCSGTVSGTIEDPQWTNIDGGQHQRFLNPLIQNEGRARALQNFAPDVPVANVVVFRDSVQFAEPMAANVVHLSELQQYIASYEFQPCDQTKLNAVWQQLRSAALTDEASRKDFRAQLSFS